jgi:hypothetical protein
MAPLELKKISSFYSVFCALESDQDAHNCRLMAKPKKRKLCDLCVAALATPASIPTHLVHPETEELSLYDIHGMAKCRICGSQWHRNHVGVNMRSSGTLAEPAEQGAD